jgi:hypothetical protein
MPSEEREKMVFSLAYLLSTLQKSLQMTLIYTVATDEDWMDAALDDYDDGEIEERTDARGILITQSDDLQMRMSWRLNLRNAC